jgi:hypothetical protein
MTRVLQFAPDSGALEVGIARDDKTLSTTVRLPEGWRISEDPSWRQSTGVMGPSSGFWGVKADANQRRQLGLDADDLAVRITFIWGPWIRETGLRNGDYVVSIDGRKSDMTIRQLQAYLQLNRNWGDTVPLVIRRDGKDLELQLRFPATPPDE